MKITKAIKLKALSTIPALIAGAFVGAQPAHALGPEDLIPQGTAHVAQVVDGDTVRLDDGREIRLVGIQAPKLPLGRSDFKAWPLSKAAKTEMENLCLGKTVNVFIGATETDRHGRTLAHLVVGDGDNKIWLQGEMLARGMARVYTFADNKALAGEMLALERSARKNKHGIWANPFYKIISHKQTSDHIGGFKLVEGMVLDAQVVGKRAYLNFGPEWRTDFTVTIEKPGLKIFANAGIDPISFKGKNIRVRGWIRRKNGPMIEITHPEQIEIIN